MYVSLYRASLYSDALGTAEDHQLSNYSRAKERQTLYMLAEQFIRSTYLSVTAQTYIVRVWMCRDATNIHTRLHQAASDDDDVFYLFLQKQKIGAELCIYLEEGTYHKRLFRGPNTNDMKK